jgi:hypothetical protein
LATFHKSEIWVFLWKRYKITCLLVLWLHTWSASKNQIPTEKSKRLQN